MELTSKYTELVQKNNSSSAFTLRDMPLFNWFIVAFHIIVIFYYAHHYQRVANDGYWNNLSSYEELAARDPQMSWHTYLAYLFWAPSDSPGIDDGGKYVDDSEGHLNGMSYLGMLVFLLAFLLWECVVICYLRSPRWSKRRFIYASMLTVLFAWVMAEGWTLYPYLSHGRGISEILLYIIFKRLCIQSLFLWSKMMYKKIPPEEG